VVARRQAVRHRRHLRDRPERPVGRRVRQPRHAARSGRRPGLAEDLRRLRQGAAEDQGQAAGQRAGDHARQQGAVPGHPPLGTLQGVYSPAQEVRDWIFHRQGQTFDNDGNKQSLEKLKAWNDAGYFGRGDDYNGRAELDAANLFARGKGAFMLGGNWNAQTVVDFLKDDAAFFDMPPGPTGKAAAIGSASVPIHISAKTKNPDLAAAYLDFIAGRPVSQALVDTTQVPAIVDPTAQPSARFAQEVAKGWETLVDAGGLTLYPDWSSPTMLETMGQSFQELLAGRVSVGDVTKRIQDDWSAYDKELGGS
jgi:raffinose/stachyose/melibiose transport system substrate-binding protein